MSFAPNPVYAPRPSAAYAAPGYPPPNPFLQPGAPGPYSGGHSRDPSATTLAPSTYSHDDVYNKSGRISVDYRAAGGRTPSPTPSEAEVLKSKTRSCDLNGIRKTYLNPEWLKQPRNLVTFIITILVIGGLIAFIALQNKIIDALRPAQSWLLHTPGAWAIPIAIMIALSFPPLFGHEIVAIFCGIVWGPWIGFAIVAAGTVLGELCTYYVFKYACTQRAQKSEEKNLRYALLAEVIRQGGFKVAIIVRYSTIPGHLTTAIFATCGMPVTTFLVAAVLSLPKQFATVYLGYAEDQQANSSDGKKNKTTTVVKIVVITLTVLITIFAMRYVNAQIDAIKGRVVYERRKKRQAKEAAAGVGGVSRSLDPADLEDPASAPLVSPSQDDIALSRPAHMRSPSPLSDAQPRTMQTNQYRAEPTRMASPPRYP